MVEMLVILRVVVSFNSISMEGDDFWWSGMLRSYRFTCHMRQVSNVYSYEVFSFNRSLRSIPNKEIVRNCTVDAKDCPSLYPSRLLDLRHSRVSPPPSPAQKESPRCPLTSPNCKSMCR